MTLKKTIIASVALAAGFIVAGGATPALAAQQPACTITNVAWDDSNGGGSVNILCGGKWYWNWRARSGCTAQSADTVKMWMSMAQAAMLSGKQVVFDTTSCGGMTDVFTWMQINN